MVLTDGLQRLLRLADDWLFPEKVLCLCCDAPLDGDADGLCPACQKALARLEAQQAALSLTDARELAEGVSALYAAFPYEDEARTLIVRLKYQSIRACAVPLIRAMTALPAGDEELLVPVPTTRRRLKSRGFNQAEVLCRGLSKAWGMPMCSALIRTEDRHEQAGLSAKARRENLVGSMKAVQDVRGKRILLVDDVYTTGSTASEAARALLEAGAASVSLAAAARTILPEPGEMEALFRPKPRKNELFSK